MQIIPKPHEAPKEGLLPKTSVTRYLYMVERTDKDAISGWDKNPLLVICADNDQELEDLIDKNMLRGICSNDPNKRYRYEPLPREFIKVTRAGIAEEHIKTGVLNPFRCSANCECRFV